MGQGEKGCSVLGVAALLVIGVAMLVWFVVQLVGRVP